MIYNDRVCLIREQEEVDFLGKRLKRVSSAALPCMRSALSNNEQMGLFGKYDLNAFKLHLQGVHGNFDSILYHGEERRIKGKKYHRNSTVIYV